MLAIAGDDDIVRLHDMTKKKLVCEFKAHETRQVFFFSFPKQIPQATSVNLV